jgi:glycosyltransferase involved in cell wall biosynthesis
MSAQTIGVFHPGTQHSWHTAIAFQGTDQLGWHATSIFCDPGRWPWRAAGLLPGGIGARIERELRRRYTPELDPRHLRIFGLSEWAEVLARRLGFMRMADAINIFGNRQFGRQVIGLIEREPVDVVWGFNTSALEVFRWAKRRGIRCVLDQTIGHPRAMNEMFAAEYAIHGEFFGKKFEYFDSAAIARQDEEAALADIVVCGSDFCADTMRDNGCAAEKLRVVPYGFSEKLFPDIQPVREPLAGRPVRFLFVGTVEPRKGAPYLLEAFSEIPPSDATLTLIGRCDIPAPVMARFAGRVTHIPHLPRNELIAHYRAADCFIFPSLFEGSALVLGEAVGAGLGVINSRSAGDGAHDGQNGMVLDHVDVSSVRAAIRGVVEDRGRLLRWQNTSWRMRKERSWKAYALRVREVVAE